MIGMSVCLFTLISVNENSANIQQFDEFGGNLDRSILTAGVKEAPFHNLLTFLKYKKYLELRFQQNFTNM